MNAHECDRIKQYYDLLNRHGQLEIHPPIKGIAQNIFSFVDLDYTHLKVRNEQNHSYYYIPCTMIEFISPIPGTESDTLIRLTRQMEAINGRLV